MSTFKDQRLTAALILGGALLVCTVTGELVAPGISKRTLVDIMDGNPDLNTPTPANNDQASAQMYPTATYGATTRIQATPEPLATQPIYKINSSTPVLSPEDCRNYLYGNDQKGKLRNPVLAQTIPEDLLPGVTCYPEIYIDSTKYSLVVVNYKNTNNVPLAHTYKGVKTVGSTIYVVDSNAATAFFHLVRQMLKSSINISVETGHYKHLSQELMQRKIQSILQIPN